MRRPSNSHGEKLTVSDLASKSHGDPKWLKLLIKLVDPEIKNVLFSVYLLCSRAGFRAVIQCVVGSCRCLYTGAKPGLFVLMMIEQRSDEKLLTYSKKTTKAYNDKQN